MTGNIEYAEEKRKRGGRERIIEGNKGIKEKEANPVTLGTGIGFDQLFERGYVGDASSHSREFVL